MPHKIAKLKNCFLIPAMDIRQFGDDIDANVYHFDDTEDPYFKQTYFRYRLKALNTKRVKFVIKTYA